jgi:tetratricopeptide (TPR) repeat protein
MSRHTNAISALVQFLDAFPTDAEAWCELAELYQSQGMLSQAIFCLEEALLVVPNAWNVSRRRQADPMWLPVIMLIESCVHSCMRNWESCSTCRPIFPNHLKQRSPCLPSLSDGFAAVSSSAMTTCVDTMVSNWYVRAFLLCPIYEEC